MKKLIILTQYYPPEIGAPQARLSELAHGLDQKGFQVTVLTAMPSYPKGKIYSGYGGLFKTEKQGNIKIVRTIIYPTQKTSFLPRLLNYFSFVLSSFLIGCWFVGKADFLLTESPPLFLGISGFLLSRIKRAKWIFNVSDLWPESAVRLGVVKDGLALRLSYMLERFCYKKAWMISGQSKSILNNILERFPATKAYHLSNGVDVDLFTPDKKDNQSYIKRPDTSQIIIYYGGLHGLAQGLDQVILAAKKLQNKNIKFVLIGDGPEKQNLINQAALNHLDKVIFLDPIPKSEIPDVIASADICLVPLKVYLPGAVPSKLYEAMAAGKPVILIAEGEAASIVETEKAGLVVTPGDIDGLVGAMETLISDSERRAAMGQAGRFAAEHKYNRAIIIDRFANILEEGG